MKILPSWLRDFIEIPVDNRRLAQDLTKIGVAVEGMSGEGERMVYETEITPNRPDAMNHYGVAREASAIYNVDLKPILPRLPASKPAADFPIELEEPGLCPRFTARVICEVKIQPSPAQIANRLALLDSRSISNAVDASNYTLMEMGKPTHAYDLDLLEGGKIIVRKARSGETLKTLDGVDRKLSPDDLVVADARKPVGLAGVMGGFDTMITDKTRNVLVESAWWDPATVRSMSKRHILHTDASHRFERGADFESTILSINRVAELILASGGGELQGDVVDVIARDLEQAPVALHLSEVHRFLGDQIAVHEIMRTLEKLGFTVVPERHDASEFTVQIPSWRLDVEREIDLVEELARIHGYDRFPNTLPAFVGAVVDQPDAAKDAKLRSTAMALGYSESVSLTFISHADAQAFSSAQPLEVANPISEEASVMRTSLLPGMLDMLAHNLNRDAEDVRLFEAGNVFEASASDRVERKQLCLGATVASIRKDLPAGALLDISKGDGANATELFRSFKGDVEQVLSAFQSDALCFDAETSAYYHPRRSARAVMDGTVMAQFGQLNPQVVAARKLRQDVFIGEIYLDLLYQHDLREVRYEPVSRFPAVDRDLSFIFPDSIFFEAIEQAVRALGLAELRRFMPVEIFRGGAIPQGKYSILLGASFQSTERTLRDDEVAGWAAQIVKALERLGGTQRA